MVTSWSVWTQEYRSKSAPKPLLAMDEMINNWTHVRLRIIWRPAYRTIQTTRENEKPYYNERMSKQTKISWIHETRQRQVQMALFRTSSHLSSLASQTSHTLLSPLSSHLQSRLLIHSPKNCIKWLQHKSIHHSQTYLVLWIPNIRKQKGQWTPWMLDSQLWILHLT